jgi:hypothetical protein
MITAINSYSVAHWITPYHGTDHVKVYKDKRRTRGIILIGLMVDMTKVGGYS